MDEKMRRNITDPEVMRALAHPARIAIIEHLTSGGVPLTATDAAKLVGLSPSATSYHLRALAKAGMVEDAPGRGDGRERVWRSRYAGWSFTSQQDAPPEDKAAERALIDLYLAREREQLEEWLSRSKDEPQEWYSAVYLVQTVLMITPEELVALHARIDELVEPFKRTNRDVPPEEARRVAFHTHGVPLDFTSSPADAPGPAAAPQDQV